MKDQYDNLISTASGRARDAYVDGVDRILALEPGAQDAFDLAIAADPGFALAHMGLARARQYANDGPGARAAAAAARDLANGLTSREAGHINAMGLFIDGDTAAYPAIRAHVDDHPRDALVAQTCSSVFGLIGFSGRPGREAEILAYTAALMPHYGDDWWCLSQYAFALSENGVQDKASTLIDRSLALRASNANAAHVRSHIDYETGETAQGIAFLDDWLATHDSAPPLQGHMVWHTALWSLEQGEVDQMWARVDRNMRPGSYPGLPINILTDTASILYRAELAGITVPADRWAEISAYAAQFFPKAGQQLSVFLYLFQIFSMIQLLFYVDFASKRTSVTVGSPRAWA